VHINNNLLWARFCVGAWLDAAFKGMQASPLEPPMRGGHWYLGSQLSPRRSRGIFVARMGNKSSGVSAMTFSTWSSVKTMSACKDLIPHANNLITCPCHQRHEDCQQLAFSMWYHWHKTIGCRMLLETALLCELAPCVSSTLGKLQPDTIKQCNSTLLTYDILSIIEASAKSSVQHRYCIAPNRRLFLRLSIFVFVTASPAGNAVPASWNIGCQFMPCLHDAWPLYIKRAPHTSQNISLEQYINEDCNCV